MKNKNKIQNNLNVEPSFKELESEIDKIVKGEDLTKSQEVKEKVESNSEIIVDNNCENKNENQVPKNILDNISYSKLVENDDELISKLLEIKNS